jgi:predicted amidohydrolase YtcJ
MRLISGDIYLNGRTRKAVAFDEIGIVAFDDEALELDVEPEELGGGFLTHAFMDGHAHPLFAGREHLGPDVTNAKSVAEIKEIVSSWLSANQTPHWAVGGAYDRSIVEGGLFLAIWLDEVAPDRPVVLHGSDHHTLWANTEAMRLAGVQNIAPVICVGSIDMDASGRPTGVFRETEAKELITDAIPALSISDELKALAWAQAELASLGITAVQDAWMDKGMVDVYLEAEKLDALIIHTNLAFWVRPESWREDSERFIAQRTRVTSLRSPKLAARTVKFFADGVFGSATASVKRPYDSSQGYLGDPVWSNDELNAAVEHFAAADFQIHIHAIGDAGVAMALDAIEKAGSPANSVIAHTELVADEDIDRFAQLGVIANFEPLWAREDGMLTSCLHHLGRERLDSMYRMRDILDSGTKISFGSDWPVSSPDPLLGMFTATHRALPETPEVSWTPAQRLTPTEALHAYTLAVAEQLALPTDTADLVILSGNPLKANLLELAVLETIIGGQTVFARQ